MAIKLAAEYLDQLGLRRCRLCRLRPDPNLHPTLRPPPPPPPPPPPCPRPRPRPPYRN